jgi:hypothetical protein
MTREAAFIKAFWNLHRADRNCAAAPFGGHWGGWCPLHVAAQGHGIVDGRYRFTRIRRIAAPTAPAEQPSGNQ